MENSFDIEQLSVIGHSSLKWTLSLFSDFFLFFGFFINVDHKNAVFDTKKSGPIMSV